MYYEHRKHDGSLPIVGVNTFLNPNPAPMDTTIELARSTTDEKENQISRSARFKAPTRLRAKRCCADLKKSPCATAMCLKF